MSKKRNRTKKQKKGRDLFCFGVFLSFFLGILTLVFCGIIASAYAENIIHSFERTGYWYQLGGDDLPDTVKTYVNLENMYHADQLYLCMDDVAQLCEFTVTGDHTRRTYFPVSDPSQTVTFFFSSDQVQVNGSTCRMYGDMYEENGKIYVPASFVAQYFDGFNVSVDPEDKRGRSIRLYRTSLGVEYNVLDEAKQIYAPIRFVAGKSSTLEPIKQGSVFTAAAQPTDQPTDNQ